MKLDFAAKNIKWLALFLIFWSVAFRLIPAKFYDLGGDSAQYIILAESVSRGLGLKLVNYPQEPTSFYFPPVLCYLLSPVIYFFGRNFYLMHILIAALGFLSLYFFYHIFKRYSDRPTASSCIFLLATNWAFLIYSAQYVLSDIPYLFFSSLTLFAAIRYADERSCFNKTAALMILGLVLSYLTRYSGAVLFISIAVFLFLSNKEKRLGKICLTAGIFISVFACWSALELLNSKRLTSHTQFFFLIDPYAPDRGTIFAHPLEAVLRFAGGINRIFVLLGDISFFYFINKGVRLNDLLCAIVIVFMLVGFWVKFREDKSCIFHYYFLFYLFLMFMWLFSDFIEGIRYLLPVLPFMLYYFLAGFLRVFGFFAKKPLRFLLPFSVSGFLALNLFNLAALPKASQISFNSLPAPFRNFVLLHDWIDKNLKNDGVILSRKPPITFLFTGHKAVTYAYTSDIERIWQDIQRDNVRYIIVDEFSKETYYYLLPFLYKHGDKLKLLHRIGDTGLFEIEKRG